MRTFSDHEINVKSIDNVGAIIVFVYVFSSLALSGIPNISFISPVSAAVLIAYTVMRLAGEPNISEVLSPYTPIFIFCFFTLAFSIPALPTSAGLMVSTLVAWLGAAFVAITCRSPNALAAAIVAMIAAAMANCLAIVVGYDAYVLYGPVVTDVSEAAIAQRPNGLVGNANLVAIQAILPLFLVLQWFGRKIPLVAVSAVLGLHALIATGSRKAVLLGIILVVYLGVRRKIAAFVIFISAVFFVAASVALNVLSYDAIYYTNSGVLAIDRTFGALFEPDASIGERAYFIELGTQLFSDKPLLGHGFDSFREINPLGVYSHNNFVELAVSGGLTYLVSYYCIHLFLIGKILKSIRSSRDNVPYLGSILIVLTMILLDASSVTFNMKITAITMALLLMTASRSIELNQMQSRG